MHNSLSQMKHGSLNSHDVLFLVGHLLCDNCECSKTRNADSLKQKRVDEKKLCRDKEMICQRAGKALCALSTPEIQLSKTGSLESWEKMWTAWTFPSHPPSPGKNQEVQEKPTHVLWLTEIQAGFPHLELPLE